MSNDNNNNIETTYAVFRKSFEKYWDDAQYRSRIDSQVDTWLEAGKAGKLQDNQSYDWEVVHSFAREEFVLLSRNFSREEWLHELEPYIMYY